MYRDTRNANYPEDRNFNDFDSDLHSIMDYISKEAEYIKPYLRPLDSMTEEEKEEYHKLTNIAWSGPLPFYALTFDGVDWLNENKFDYRGLIPMDLALEAPEGMYKTE